MSKKDHKSQFNSISSYCAMLTHMRHCIIQCRILFHLHQMHLFLTITTTTAHIFLSKRTVTHKTPKNIATHHNSKIIFFFFLTISFIHLLFLINMNNAFGDFNKWIAIEKSLFIDVFAIVCHWCCFT